MKKQNEHTTEGFTDNKAPYWSLIFLLCYSQVPRFLISQEKSTTQLTQDLYTNLEAT